MLWQQALNEPASSEPANDVRALQRSGMVPNQLEMVEWTNRPQSADPCYLTLENYAEVTIAARKLPW